MKIITEPTVHLIATQQIEESELNGFLNAHDVGHWDTDTDVDAERLVEVAGRVCYMSFAKPRPGGNKAYIDHILEVGHGSVLEHAVFSLLITGVSRSLTHELIRHRAGFGYSQLSQRFVDESDCDFVLPPLLQELIDWDAVPESEGGNLEQGYDESEFCHVWFEWHESICAAQKSYERLSNINYVRLAQKHLPASVWHDGKGPESFAELNDAIASLPAELRTAIRKRAREAARSVLPNCTATKIFMTGNARAWRHFIEMRGSIHADAEIQRLAVAVLDKLRNAAPNLFGDYDVHETGISTLYKKV